MGVAVFNYSLWAARYPKLAVKVDEPLATAYFAEAGLYCDNSDCSPIDDLNVRLLLLNMLVAHIAALNGATAAGDAGLVGRISSVTEGSVTISTDMNVSPGSEAWYAQTTWGAQFWAATVGYRSGFYVPGPVPATGGTGLTGWGAPRWPY